MICKHIFLINEHMLTFFLKFPKNLFTSKSLNGPTYCSVLLTI